MAVVDIAKIEAIVAELKADDIKREAERVAREIEFEAMVADGMCRECCETYCQCDY